MKVVLQRVHAAAVRVEGRVVGDVGLGLLALVGVGDASTEDDARWLAAKTAALRVLGDDAGLMNRSVGEVGGGVLAVSQFTLYGDVRKGRRPSFVHAAEPERGDALYRIYCTALEAAGVPTARGVFGAEMRIAADLAGPTTILLQREGGVSP